MQVTLQPLARSLARVNGISAVNKGIRESVIRREAGGGGGVGEMVLCQQKVAAGARAFSCRSCYPTFRVISFRFSLSLPLTDSTTRVSGTQGRSSECDVRVQ